MSSSSEKNFYSSNKKQHLIKERRDILDRNGSVLATNVTLYDVGVRPKLLNEIEKKNLLIKLGLLYPELDLTVVKKKLYKENFFQLEKD